MCTQITHMPVIVRVEALLNIRCIIILLLLLAISLFAKVQLLLPEFFCEHFPFFEAYRLAHV